MNRKNNRITFDTIRARGVIMVITMLAVLLLAGLVLWVLNLGQQVNHRVDEQHVADSTVRAGAGWIARSLNTVAANNADMARYIGLINVMDAMPQSADFTYRESESMRQALERQLSRGIHTQPSQLDQIVTDNFSRMLDELTGQVADVKSVDDFFKSVDVKQMTDYGRNGSIWQALYALDELNQGIMDNLGTMAQVSALAGGRADQTVGDAAAFMLPLAPTLPHQRGSFNDFEQPVLDGRLPPQTDDPVINRGPWDAVYGWRDLQSETSGGTFVPGSKQVAGGGNPGNPLSRGPGGGGGGHWVGQTTTVTSYSTFGPQSWMLRRLGDYNYDHLFHTRYSFYAHGITKTKSDYLWPRGAVRKVIDPDWRNTLAEAESIAQAGTPEIHETAYFCFEIKSKYPRDDARFLTPGTWALELEENDGINPHIAIRRGWVPLRDDKKISPDVWRYEWEYSVFYDNEIGITQQMQTVTNPDGTTTQAPLPQPVYRIDHFIFGGVNVGNDANIDSPYGGFDPGAADAPSPTDLDHGTVPQNDLDARWHYLSYLGVARRTDRPQAWESRFRGGRPYPNMVAIAQAKVFNNHSWDLWTQMWRAEMEPVSNYDGWVEAITSGSSNANVPTNEIDDLAQYLGAASGLAQITLGH
ncbi:MAG: hypothetical protein GC162_02590 [Planctomycetes bacterium]|nr:hypothetical protein [Planctomycetota bacterium]